MTPTGNIPQKYVWEFPGNPTNAAISILNPPKGAIVIDSTTGEIYLKTTGYANNSGFYAIMAHIAQAIATANSAATDAASALALLGNKMSRTGSDATLPSSDPLEGGALWSDTNTVKVSAG